jgi:hypothetical protein
MPVPEWVKSPKGIALIGAGIGIPAAIAAFYIVKLRQTIVTVTTSRPDQIACDPTTDVTVTITVTDGLGRPRAFEPLTIELFIDGMSAGKWDVRTNPAGAFTFSLPAKGWCSRVSHTDTEETFMLTIMGTAREASGVAAITVKVKACTNWTSNPDCPSDYPYGCA